MGGGLPARGFFVIFRDLVHFEGLAWGGVFPSVKWRDLLNWVSCVYPPL